MKNYRKLLNYFCICTLLGGLLIVQSCTKVGMGSSADMASSGGGTDSNNNAGVLTAGEWNDLDNWAFWQNLITKDTNGTIHKWGFFNKHRVDVLVTNSSNSPMVNIPVVLKRNGQSIFKCQTDNYGKAVLWVDLLNNTPSISTAGLSIDVNNGAQGISNVLLHDNGTNVATINNYNVSNEIDVCFVVDATGSMGDELNFLKNEFLDVISRVKNANSNATLKTAAVYYRDEKDDYLTRHNDFTNDEQSTINFIKKQNAGGGGDLPEAVDAALACANTKLTWNEQAKTKIIFLVLDAPPHDNTNVRANLANTITKLAERGIKVIPVTASGIDKDTEFLMRAYAMSTNGTYVFITNDSGVGNNHIEATVGEYQVEFLNDLMVRLINKYAQ
jgi:hypothetical protein